jgi:predicted permease
VNARHALRRLRQSPGFTLVAVLSLAIGIGANTAIFTLIDAVLLRRPQIREPERLVEVFLSTPEFEFGTLSFPDFRDARDGAGDALTAIAATRFVLASIEREGTIESAVGEAVTGHYFTMLGLEPHLGRLLQPDDDRAPGAHPVVVLGFRYWQKAFGGNPGAVGTQLRIGGRPYTIVGVAPEDYAGRLRGLVPALYAPMMMVNQIQPTGDDELEERGNHSCFVKARLAPGVELAEAQARLDAVAASLTERSVESWDREGRFLLRPSAEVIVMPQLDRFIRAAAWLLSAVVGLVLLLACINLASFLLARAIDRRKEMALRRALGATRAALAGQLLLETTLLAGLGGLAGVAVGAGLLRVLERADLPLPLPIELDLRIDGGVLLFTLAVSLVAGLVLGLAPALHGSRGDLAATLRDDSAGGGQRGRARLRNALVVAQVALSTLLLVGAGLFLRSFERLQAVDPGFGHQPSAVVSLLIPADRYGDDAARRFARTLVERVRATPGVDEVGLTDNLHLNTLSTNNTELIADGVAPPPGRLGHGVDRARVDQGFFAAAGIPILDGRGFDDDLDRRDTQRVAIVNQTLADRFWPGGDAIGKRLRATEGDAVWEVVGVTRDVKVRTLGEAPRPLFYLALSQSNPSFVTIVATTARDRDPERLALDLVAAAHELDGALPIFEVKTMERHVGIMLLPARLSALLLTAFAALALALASIGLYGLVSYAVAQRAREVGIRMSLGADAASMVRLLFGGGLRLVLLGGAIGLLLAVAAARLVGGLLFEVSASDPVAFLAVALVLGAAATLAAWLPARRAARISPAVALRAE